jgi:hypothetical protein
LHPRGAAPVVDAGVDRSPCVTEQQRLGVLPSNQPGFARSPAAILDALIGQWQTAAGDRFIVSAADGGVLAHNSEAAGPAAGASTSSLCEDRFDVMVNVSLVPVSAQVPNVLGETTLFISPCSLS